MIQNDLTICFKNFEKFINEQESFYHQYLAQDCSHAWKDDVWHIGRKGTGWLQGNSTQSLNFKKIGKTKGILNSPMDISDLSYRDFMKAVLVARYRNNGGSISAAQAVKVLIMLKRWYAALLSFGKSHPVYLETKILEHAMASLSAAELKNTNGLPNHKGLCVALQRYVNFLNFTQSKLDYVSDSPYLSMSSMTEKALKQRQEDNRQAFGGFDIEGRDYLISIATFINVIELMHRVRTDGERLALNFLLLLIITGFRSVEVCNLRFDSLVKRSIPDSELKERFRKKGISTYYLGIKYHGAKGAGERIHWVEPLAVPLVEMIYQNVLHITKPMRDILIDLRIQKFQSYIPTSTSLFLDEYLDRDDMLNYFFESKSIETRGMAAARDNIRKVLKNKGVPERKERMTKYGEVFYHRDDIESMIKEEFISSGCNKFNPCTHQWNDSGKLYSVRYEELLFLHFKGSTSMNRQLIFKTVPIPFTNKVMNDFLGANRNISVFQKYNLVEPDGSVSKLRTHIPRHNINTFLAIAGVEDHLQAMLMGRLDIGQNHHYQHLTENLLAKTVHVSAVSNDGVDLGEIDYITPQEIVEKTGCIAYNPNLDLDTNLKVGLGTFDGSKDFVSYLRSGADVLSDTLVGCQAALDELGEDMELEEVSQKNSQALPLPIGFCVKQMVNWGCVYRLKCQSGEFCPHFTLTGRMDEYAKLPAKRGQLEDQIKILEDLQETTSGYDKALARMNHSKENLTHLQVNLSQYLTSLNVVQIEQILDSTTSFKALAQLFALEQHKINEVS